VPSNSSSGPRANGGEIVNFSSASSREQRYLIWPSGKLEKSSWRKSGRKYTIELGDKDLTRIKSGFGSRGRTGGR